MNKDLIETPRFICSLGDEVLLKGRIVGFDVDENKCVENVVRLEYGQTLNVPNCNIYTKNNIIDEPEKVKIPQFVAEIIEYYKGQNATLYDALREKNFNKQYNGWLMNEQDAYNKVARAWLDGYDIQETKYVVTDGNHLYFKKYQEDIEIVILVDEQPGTMEYVKKFDTKEEAQKAADILGWKVQEVE
ncbi:DUF1642 domain-containing protein [Glaesserella parasuis]|nr:DUF1642 domain-containing protein [Glaesserella parasuis]